MQIMKAIRYEGARTLGHLYYRRILYESIEFADVYAFLA